MKSRLVSALIAMLLAGCANMPTQQAAKQEAEARWEQMRAKVKLQLAERSFDGGQIDDALRFCQEALNLDSTSLNGQLLMARIQLEKGQAAEAESALDAAAGLGQDLPELAYLRGMLTERREQMADALNWYRKAYEAKPNEADYLLAYAESMLTAGKTDAALDLLVRREPDFEQNLRVQMLLGQTYALQGEYRKSGDAYMSALRLAPNDPLLREEVGLVLLAAKQLDEAQTVLEPLLKSGTDKPSPALVEALASALLAANRSAAALSLLETAVLVHPESFALNLLASKAWLCADKPGQAEEAARRASRLRPESTEARLLLTYCAIVAGDRDQAIATAQEIIAIHPDDAEALALLERAIRIEVADGGAKSTR